MRSDRKIENFRKYLSGISLSEESNSEEIVKQYLEDNKDIATMTRERDFIDFFETLELIVLKQQKIIKLGKFLKTTRQKHNLSASQLGELSKVSPSLISKIENGKSSMPKASSLFDLAYALKIEPDEFFVITKAENTRIASIDSHREKIYRPDWKVQIKGILYEQGFDSEDLEQIIEFVEYRRWKHKNNS